MKRAAVIFDLDDTLYPSNSFVAGGIRAAAMVLRAEGHVIPDPLDVFEDVLRREGPFSLFDSGFRMLGIEKTPELVSRLVAAFRSHQPEIRPYPGVVDLLLSLKERGVGTGLVTDGYADVQRSKFRALGFGHLFDTAVFCRDVDGGDFPKPDPFPFARAYSNLSNPDSVVFVGDNPSMDFPAPDSFGWKTIRMCWPDGTHVQDGDVTSERIIARSAGELEAALNRIVG